MTEHSEIRIPVQDVKLALTCQECKTEVVIDPAQNAQRWTGTHATLECGVCHRPFDSAIVKALQYFIMGAGELGAHQMTVAARKSTEPGQGRGA